MVFCSDVELMRWMMISHNYYPALIGPVALLLRQDHGRLL